MKQILLAEDDYDLGKSLKQYLELNKFKIIWAKDGDEALELFKKNIIDLCLIDVMMPKTDGFNLSKKILNLNYKVPFLFLTARKTKEDRIKGLRLGADDYIAKPFEVEELILRIQNIIKRTEKQNLMVKDVFIKEDVTHIGKYLFDPNNLELQIDTDIIKLTDKEARLITYLNSNKNQMIKRDELLIKFWENNDFFSGRSMDVFISRIRKHFKEDENISIKSFRGIGLEFNVREHN